MFFSWWWNFSVKNSNQTGKRLAFHSSEKRGLCSINFSGKVLHNLLYFLCIYKNTYHVGFFHYMQLGIFTLWMPYSMLTRAFIREKAKFPWNISLSSNIWFLKSGLWNAEWKKIRNHTYVQQCVWEREETMF